MKRLGLATLMVLLALMTALPVTAQYVRLTGGTGLRYVELRSLVRDSIAEASATGTGLLRQLPDGRVVRCIPGEAFCRDARPGPVVSALPVIQDLEASVWGFGQGLRAYAQLRGRSTLSGDRQLWPRADDVLDVLALFGEYDRGRLRVRAGRQWKVSGLGFYNFDGLAVAARANPALTIEAYAGRSLVRGLNGERSAGALESVESLNSPEPGVLLGIDARYRPSTRLALNALYQIDVRYDRRGLYSELAAASGVLNLGRHSAEANVELDVATGQLNQAGITLRTQPIASIVPFAELRRYRPYFELWTIWGAFSPIGFDEARAGASWASRSGQFLVRSETSYRMYEDLGVDRSVDEYRSRGWGLGGTVGYTPTRDWRLQAAYRIETSFGAAGRDAAIGVTRFLGEASSLNLQALAFEQLYEFRLSEGTVVGLAAEASMPLTRTAQLFASAAIYRHLNAGAGSGLDWNQRRASVRVSWMVGTEPGLTVRTGDGQ